MFAASPALSGPSTLSLHLHRDLAIRWLAPQPVHQRRVPAPPAPAPNGPSLHSSRLPVPASASHPALASTTSASPVPVDSSRFVPSFCLTAVKRNFLLWPIRNFSLGRDKVRTRVCR